MLAANQLTEDGYVNLLRTEIKRTQLVGAVAAGAQAPGVLVDDLFRRQAERRIAETVLVPNAAMGDVGTPDDATLTAFHQEKAVRFTAPEFRKLTVAQADGRGYRQGYLGFGRGSARRLRCPRRRVPDAGAADRRSGAGAG